MEVAVQSPSLPHGGRLLSRAEVASSFTFACSWRERPGQKNPMRKATTTTTRTITSARTGCLGNPRTALSIVTSRTPGPLQGAEGRRFDPFLARYFGMVQGNSPGWSRAHECPVHVEFGSSGGPHHGERSAHQYSPVNMPTTPMKPRTATIANTTRIAVSQTRSSVVTAASYVQSLVCQGSQ